ncbi:MAG: hypothetical protein R3B41_04270 [Candidatus Doudnabacteria bacterium]
MNEQDLEKQIGQYAELAKDKNIDAAILVINSLQQTSDQISGRQKRWAYLSSLGFPPVGFLWAGWFMLGDKSDKKSTAIICLVLTIISGIIFLLFTQALFTSSGVSPEQIQTINPQDIKQLIN